MQVSDHGAREVSCPQCWQRVLVPPLHDVANMDTTDRNVSTPPPFEAYANNSLEQVGTTPYFGESAHSTATTPSSVGCVLVGLGVAIICIGVILLLFFAVVYDTSVPVYPAGLSENIAESMGLKPEGYVSNVHKMQNRLIGIIIGSVAFVAGVALVIAGGMRR